MIITRHLYVNSPGGSLTDGLAISDAMQCLRAPVRTISIGQAAWMAAGLLAASTKGQRPATPNSEAMIHQASTRLSRQADDIRPLAERMRRLQDDLVPMLAGWPRQVGRAHPLDMQRDFYMTAEGLWHYGSQGNGERAPYSDAFSKNAQLVPGDLSRGTEHWKIGSRAHREAAAGAGRLHQCPSARGHRGPWPSAILWHDSRNPRVPGP